MTGTELTAFCDRLNAEAIALRDASDGDDYKALRTVARVNGLEQVSPDFDDLDQPASCVIFVAPDGTRLNLWIDPPGPQEICEGGMGFDDNTDWYEG